MSTDDAGPSDDAEGTAEVPGGERAPLGPDTLAEAVGATRGVSNARVELTTTVDGPAGAVVLTHRAAFVDGGLRASAESDMSQVAQALGDAGQQLDGDWSHPARVVVATGTVYSQLGPMAESLGRSPGDWSSAELADLVGSGAVADNDTLALALDPLGPLDQLLRPVVEIGEAPTAASAGSGDAGTSEAAGDAAAGEAAGDGGREQVRGVPARHVRASLDLAGGAAAAPLEGSFESRLVAAGVDALPVDVWLDADGLVRRLAVTFESAGGLSTTFDVFDVGEVPDADVAPPPPDDVIDPGAVRRSGD